MKMTPSDSERATFAPVLQVLTKERAALCALPAVCAVRPGYTPHDDKPALVVAVEPGGRFDPAALAAHGVPISVVDATPREQLYSAAERAAPSDMELLLRATPGAGVSFAAPRVGNYKPPPHLKLDTVEDVMSVELSTSPDVGWTVVRDFLAAGVKKSLTIGIYQFTAPHIYKALRRAVLASPKATLALCRQPKSEAIAESGNKADDLDGDVIVQRLQRALGARFEFVHASVGKGGAFASAYHIKVAVVDEQRFWLSSGNWQSSNQAPFDPIDEPDALPAGYFRNYNREYHAVIEHPGLSQTFEGFLDYDRELPGAFDAGSEDLPSLELPFERDEPAFAVEQTFAPLRLQDERVRVTPVLTPDNYAAVVRPMLEAATKSIYLQNQYINLNPTEDLDAFHELVSTLRDRGKAGVEIRLILRDFMEPEKVDMLLALGFERRWFRFLKSCHAKLVVVDRKVALVGSHNWSNEGTVTNRDASLLFEHAQIARYFADIFEHDWEHRARPRAARQPRVVRSGASFAAGRTVPWSSLYDAAPRPRPLAPMVNPTSAAAPAAAPAASVAPARRAAGAVSFGLPGGDGGSGARGGSQSSPPAGEAVPFGIDGDTGQRSHPPLGFAALRAAARGEGGGGDVEREVTHRRRGESFDLPFGTDQNDLRGTGWGVVYAQGTPQAVRDALAPLVALRKSQVPARFFREIDYPNGESLGDFFRRHNVGAGTQLPHKLPYHLLLVGSPKDIPFEFQYQLDLEYSVGRLWLEDAAKAPDIAGFSAYARALVDYEAGVAKRPAKSIGYFAPKHGGDVATQMSHDDVVTPIFKGNDDFGAIATTLGAAVTAKLGPEAKRAALADLFVGDPGRTAVVFSASHGMQFSAGHALQRSSQGAILTQDWTGFGQIAPAHYLSAGALPQGSAGGLVAFLFACYGAGTPRLDSYPDGGPPVAIADEPFIAALPQELLRRGALAVVGHVDLAWAYSFRPLDAGSAQLAPFVNCIGRLLSGERVGNATTNLHSRAAVLGTLIADMLSPSNTAPVDDRDLAEHWVERNDARAYVLLGDPAAKLAF